MKNQTFTLPELPIEIKKEENGELRMNIHISYFFDPCIHYWLSILKYYDKLSFEYLNSIKF